MAESFVLVSRGNTDVEHLSRVISELQTGSDRAVAIVGGSLVEGVLDDALKCHLHRNKKISESLFNTSGALGAFGAKIDLGFLVGIYGAKAHKNLSILRKIRNEFAHSLTVSDFKTQKIRDLASNLDFCERYTKDNSDVRGSQDRVVGKPLGERDWWIGVTNRTSMLKQPRERYLIVTQLLIYGLSVPQKTAMPTPLF